jgi:hypothetical protein
MLIFANLSKYLYMPICKNNELMIIYYLRIQVFDCK